MIQTFSMQSGVNKTLLLCVLLGLAHMRLPAQAVRVGSRGARPQLTLLDTITVTASPASVSFALVSRGTATGSSPIAVTSNWSGNSLLGSLDLYGYFASASPALSGGTPVASIPSSDVFGQCPTGIPTTFTAFTQTTPFSGAAGLHIYSNSSILSLGGGRTDSLNLMINLTSLPQQPAATYIGVLVLQAQAF